MKAQEFTNKWIDIDEEVPDFGNDPAIPVIVRRREDGALMSVKDLSIEYHEVGGYTVWIEVEDY